MSPAEAARQVKIEVRGIVREICTKAVSRGVRGVNLLRGAALNILGQDGSGRRYRNGHVASAPGQAPAPLTGNLRRNWHQQVLATGNGGGVRVVMRIKSQMFYADFLEHGTRKMAARPFHDRIKTKARPAIEALYGDL